MVARQGSLPLALAHPMARHQASQGMRRTHATEMSAGKSLAPAERGRRLERHELRQRLRRVVDLIRIADEFAPFDWASYNIALEIW